MQAIPPTLKLRRDKLLAPFLLTSRAMATIEEAREAKAALKNG